MIKTLNTIYGDKVKIGKTKRYIYIKPVSIVMNPTMVIHWCAKEMGMRFSSNASMQGHLSESPIFYSDDELYYDPNYMLRLWALELLKGKTVRFEYV